jgi:hypothetical protein
VVVGTAPAARAFLSADLSAAGADGYDKLICAAVALVPGGYGDGAGGVVGTPFICAGFALMRTDDDLDFLTAFGVVTGAFAKLTDVLLPPAFPPRAGKGARASTSSSADSSLSSPSIWISSRIQGGTPCLTVAVAAMVILITCPFFFACVALFFFRNGIDNVDQVNTCFFFLEMTVCSTQR